jgi:hypothetical protein
MNHACLLGQKFTRKSGFPRAVRSSNDNALWRQTLPFRHRAGDSNFAALTLEGSPQLALRRIAARVKQGGHNVPRPDVQLE